LKYHFKITQAAPNNAAGRSAARGPWVAHVWLKPFVSKIPWRSNFQKTVFFRSFTHDGQYLAYLI